MAMNKIVLEHYPVSKLPEDMREGLDASAMVKVVIEEESRENAPVLFPGFSRFASLQPGPMTIDQALDNVRRSREADTGSVTMDEAVARIRSLRDEWDDE